MAASPTPNFFSACRRVVDWAKPLASSSNLSFILFLSFCLLCCFPRCHLLRLIVPFVRVGRGVRTAPLSTKSTVALRTARPTMTLLTGACGLARLEALFRCVIHVTVQAACDTVLADVVVHPGARPVRQTEAGQRHSGQADAKLLQRLPPRY